MQHSTRSGLFLLVLSLSPLACGGSKSSAARDGQDAATGGVVDGLDLASGELPPDSATAEGGINLAVDAEPAGSTPRDAGGGEVATVPVVKVTHVSPLGAPTNDGSSFAQALDYKTAFANVQPGDVVLLQAGTYSVPFAAGMRNTLTFGKTATATAPIRIETADQGRAIFDFGCPEQTYVQDGFGFLVSGKHYVFKGIDITRAAYQGAYVTGDNNTFDNCSFHDNRNTGLEINEGGSNTTVRDCDAYRNYDPKKNGSMSDGFAAKQLQGAGNHFIGCRSWENGDDGYDLYDSAQAVTIEGCWAIRNGIDVWGYGSFAGNGNGFKVGGNAKVAHHTVTRSVAIGNRVKGFDQNNNAGGVTLFNNTGYQNGINFGFGNAVSSGEQHTLKNNVSYAGVSPDTIKNALASNNSWQLPASISESDFLSLETSVATGPRNPDGSLPTWNLLRPTLGSALIDQGVDVGLPFQGGAPDLGAFETTP
jgi:hypothetical protein